MVYLKLSKRYDEAKNGEIANIQSYSYFGEPDGYPKYTPDELPSDYTYSTSVYSQDGSRDVFVYGNTHDTLSKTEYINNMNTKTKEIFLISFSLKLYLQSPDNHQKIDFN